MFGVVMGSESYVFLGSAFRHGLTREQIIHAWTHAIAEILEGEDPPKVVRIGLTDSMLPLEIGAHISDDGQVVFFHAMKARTKYLRQMGGRR